MYSRIGNKFASIFDEATQYSFVRVNNYYLSENIGHTHRNAFFSYQQRTETTYKLHAKNNQPNI